MCLVMRQNPKSSLFGHFLEYSSSLGEPEEQVAPDVFAPDAAHQIYELSVWHKTFEELFLGNDAVAVEVELFGDRLYQIADLLVEQEALHLC